MGQAVSGVPYGIVKFVVFVPLVEVHGFPLMGDSKLRHQFQLIFSSLLILDHVGIPVVCENMLLATLSVHFFCRSLQVSRVRV